MCFKRLSLLLMTACVCLQLCGCTQQSGNTEQSENSSETSNELNAPILNEQAESGLTASESDSQDIKPANSDSTNPDNWYVDGYTIPSNWTAVMTSDEAFEHFDEVIGETQHGKGKSIDEIIKTLLNRNVIAFEILYGRDPAYEFDDDIDPSSANNPNVHPIRSDYFNCLDDIINIMNGTYTETLAEERLNGSNGERKLFLEEDGKLFVDYDSMYYWSSDPFQSKTYIEILDSSESECIFVWHYIAWERWDYEDNDTTEFYPHHMQMTFRAVTENGEWRLTSIIFDNPALGIDNF